MKNIPQLQNTSEVPAEFSPGLFLQVAARMVQQIQDQTCRDASVPPVFIVVLKTIQRNPGIRQGLCADNLGFDATTFGRYIDRLVREGYVERAIPPADRRAVSLSLTPEGEQLVESCTPIFSDFERQLHERMGSAEWKRLSALLLRLLDAFDHPLPNLARAQKVAFD